MRAAAILLWACLPLGAGTLDGRVVEDHTGNPLASVELRVHKIGQRTLAAHLETDTNGAFHAENLPDGEYRIEAAKTNYVGATLRLARASTGLVIRLVRCGVITGQVLDGQGQPVLSAFIYVMPKPANGAPPRPLTSSYTRVDEHGRYRVHGLRPGDYAVAVSYGASTAMFGYSGGAEVRAGVGSGVQLYPTNQRPQFFSVTGGEQYRNIDFAILPTTLHNVSGKVALPDPKSHFWLALVSADQPSLATAVTATRADGGFTFEGVPNGSYTLTASGPVLGYGGKAVLAQPPYFGRTQVSVGNDLDGINVTVQPGRALLFRLRPTGEGCPPAAQIALTALDDFAAQIDRTGEINSEKEMPVTDLAPARYQVGLNRLGDACYQPAPLQIDLASSATAGIIDIPVASAGAIRGKLTGAPDPSHFTVALLSADPDAGTQPLQLVSPAADGRFAFGSLRPGRYRLVAQLAGTRWVADAAHMIELQIPAGSPTELELPAPREVHP